MKGLHTDLQSFIHLHDYLKNIDSGELNEWIYRAEANNPWFTIENVKSALDGIIELLEPMALERFFSTYTIFSTPKKIGVIMAEISLLSVFTISYVCFCLEISCMQN